MKILFKSVVIALIYYCAIILSAAVLFLLFTAVFQRWDLWEKIITTETGNVIYFIVSILGMLVGLYMGMAYVEYAKRNKENEKEN